MTWWEQASYRGDITFKIKRRRTYTLPSGVSRKQMGSNDALAHITQDMTWAFSAGLSFSSLNEFIYKRMAPDSNTLTSSLSVKQGIWPKGCGFLRKSPISNSNPSSYKAQFTSGERDPCDPYKVRPMPSNVVDDHDVVALGVTRRGPFTKATETDDSQHKMKLLYNSMFAVIEIVVMRNGWATHRTDA